MKRLLNLRLLMLLAMWPVVTLGQGRRYTDVEGSTINTLSVTNLTNVTNLDVTNITAVTNLSVTNISNVTNINMNNGGGMGGGQGQGNIKYTNSIIDVFTVNAAWLRLQFQPDDTAIVDGDLLGHLDFYADDDTTDADSIAGQIEVFNVGTRTDGVEGGKMVLNVAKTDGTLNANQLVLNTDGTISISSGRISGLTQTYRFNMADPPTLQGNDTQWCLDPNTAAAKTITKIEVTLDADPTTELDMDVKYADAFIGLANPVIISVIDTTAGTSNITTMTGTSAVPAGKAVYVEFGGAPDAATLQGCFVIYWDYD